LGWLIVFALASTAAAKLPGAPAPLLDGQIWTVLSRPWRSSPSSAPARAEPLLDTADTEPPPPADPSPTVGDGAQHTTGWQPPPGLPPAWQRLARKLHEREVQHTGIVRVVHFGDSEIAGDYVTGTLRARFGNRYGLAGPGFVLASQAWPTYLRTGWRVADTGWKSSAYVYGALKSGQYGPAGVALEAPASSSAQVALESPPKGACEVQFFHQTQPTGAKVQLLADKTVYAEVDTQVESQGESRVAVHRHTFERCPRLLTVKTLPGRSAQVYGWNVEAASGGVLWSSMGVIAARSTQLTLYDDANLRESIAALAPDLLVLSFDLNNASVADAPNATYDRRLRLALRKIRAGLGDGACLVVGPYSVGLVDGGAVKASPTTAKVAKRQREAALDAGCAFLDRFELAGGAAATERWLQHKPKLLSGDYVHLTAAGSTFMGNTLAKVLTALLDGGAPVPTSVSLPTAASAGVDEAR
jgi:lysophospholipase L1-like esterase